MAFGVSWFETGLEKQQQIVSTLLELIKRLGDKLIGRAVIVCWNWAGEKKKINSNKM